METAVLSRNDNSTTEDYVIRMVGDIRIDDRVMQAAGDGKDYRFDGLFEHVRPLLKEADLAIASMETLLTTDMDRTGPLRPAAPRHLSGAVRRAGFQVVLHATEHALDLGHRGIDDTLRIWENQPDMTVLGIHRTRRDADRIHTWMMGRLRVALLNLTEPLDLYSRIRHRLKGNRYDVDLLRRSRRDHLGRKIREARETCDLVIALPHWGMEYLIEPTRSQKEWAKFLAESGADLILGTHPHVLHSPQLIRTSDGREVPCLYSLGNFISCQMQSGTSLGGMADIRISHDLKEQRIEITKAKIIPLVIHADEGFRSFTTYPLSEYHDALARSNELFRVRRHRLGTDRMDVKMLRDRFTDVMEHRGLDHVQLRTAADVRLMKLQDLWNGLRGRERMG